MARFIRRNIPYMQTNELVELIIHNHEEYIKYLRQGLTKYRYHNTNKHLIYAELKRRWDNDEPFLERCEFDWKWKMNYVN